METANPYAAPRSEAFGQDQAIASQPLAGRGARFGARLIDGVLESSPLIVAAVLTGGLASGGEQPNMIPMVLGYLGNLGIWIYQVVRLVQTGQTLGRKWLGIRIVRLDGGKVTFGSHFLRGLVFGLLGFIGVWFIFRRDRRTLHDLAAETKVIEG